MNEALEEWRDVIGYEGYYQISNLGRVKSLPRLVRNVNGYSTKKELILNPHINKGYLKTALTINKITNYKFIHKLVAEAFIPNSNNYPQVNHKDTDKLNNKKDNLEWCTPSQNMKHAYDNNLISKDGFNNSNSKLKIKQVEEIRELLTKGFKCKEISLKYSVNYATIRDIKIGRTWKNVI